jgi:hypothetical protein
VGQREENGVTKRYDGDGVEKKEPPVGEMMR